VAGGNVQKHTLVDDHNYMYLLFHILTPFHHGVLAFQLVARVAPAKMFVVLGCYICNANISPFKQDEPFDLNSELVAGELTFKSAKNVVLWG
jgi:hypothetical protein